jgi:hypothetical protein
MGEQKEGKGRFRSIGVKQGRLADVLFKPLMSTMIAEKNMIKRVPQAFLHGIIPEPFF